MVKFDVSSLLVNSGGNVENYSICVIVNTSKNVRTSWFFRTTYGNSSSDPGS